MSDKIRKILNKFSDILEWVMAIIVLIAVIAGVISLWEPFLEFVNHRLAAEAFLDFMAYVLNIVIGIEFLKMLCKPGAETVLEVLMFVIARHMIVHDTSALENLLTILGIAAIFAIKKFLNTDWDSENGGHQKGHFLNWKKSAEDQTEQEEES